jgi:hypothetical protein
MGRVDAEDRDARSSPSEECFWPPSCPNLSREKLINQIRIRLIAAETKALVLGYAYAEHSAK